MPPSLDRVLIRALIVFSNAFQEKEASDARDGEKNERNINIENPMDL